MGDRTTTYLSCPKCGAETEQYDAPSSLMWVWNCEKCGWKDDRDYYEISETNLVLCSEEEARKNGGLKTCQTCGKEVMGSYIQGEKCIECPKVELNLKEE